MQGVAIDYNIAFNGVDQYWGTDSMKSVSSSRYEAESRDSRLNVPSFRASIYDPVGQMWDLFGHGTTAFNKDIVVGVKIGGTYDDIETSSGTFFGRVSTYGADEYTLHTGKIKRVSKKNRIVSFESRNNMHIIKDLAWQLPIDAVSVTPGALTSGTRTEVTSINPLSKYDTVYSVADSIGTYKGKVSAYASKSTLNLVNYLGTGHETSDVSVGIDAGYILLDTKFRNETELVEFNYTEIQGVGTFIDWPGEADNTVTDFYWVQSSMGISGDPVNVLRHFISGKFVSDFFIDGSDVDAASFNNSAKNYSFSTFSGTLTAKTDEGEGLFSDIQDIITSTASLFFVDEVNKINLVTYGPRDLHNDLDILTGTDLTEVGVSNEIEDSYNKTTIKYAYSRDDSKFTRTSSIQADDWSGTDNRELVIESKWMTSRVEAEIINQRLFNRYKNTLPRIEFKTTLSELGRGIGDLVRITDFDSGLSEKVVQVNAYNADVMNNKIVSYSGIDGESLFLQNGYSHWEDEGDLEGTVSGTSTSGWAYGGIQSGLSNGTTPGINEDIYGTAFKWW
jgi:hypothetical protein